MPTSLLTLRLHSTAYPLTVNVIGSGSVAVFPGTVTGGPLQGDYVQGTVITLTATPIGTATFTDGPVATSPTARPARSPWAPPKERHGHLSAPLLNLNVTVIGTGSVSVCLDNGAGGCSTNDICWRGTCSYQFPYGSPLILTPITSWYTNFAGWSGACTGTGICTPTFTANSSVIASFKTQDNVMLQLSNPAVYFPTLLSAYQSIPNQGSSIFSVMAMTFHDGPLFLDRPVTFTIDGGKTSGFAPSTGGYSTLVGPLIISSGRLNATMFEIK